ncbi:hypothetical protein J5N97_015638 [Dioscorea zingiberensis]|uniref:Translocation protein SEC62 n=1 Tax=Dioscorea zingiberensis TaxID=325984 RepID=A0A9D5CJI5_9LILI|nr:hypothetical protein J5N97_015638 [Dioscorea zingiberensis]
MTKSATEKKRVRRAPQNGARDATETIPFKKAAKTKDVYQLFAEKVRDNKQLESRWAIMQETRVEYFRVKDFTVFLKNHPELKEVLGSDKDLEVEEIVNTLLMKNLLVSCDRVVKTEQVFSENDAFFAWTFMKRQTLWQAILAFSWPLVALAMCLFPVYPYQCKIVVLYTCAGALLFIVSVLVVREETTFRELIWFWPKKDEGERPKWTSRLTYAVAAVLIILLLRHHAPDEAARARYQKQVSNIIDDFLEWSPKLALSGMMDKQPTVNATEANHPTDGSGTTTAEGVAEDLNMDASGLAGDEHIADDLNGEIGAERFEDEKNVDN